MRRITMFFIISAMAVFLYPWKSFSAEVSADLTAILNTCGTKISPEDPKFWEQSRTELMSQYKGRWTKELEKEEKSVFRIYGLKGISLFEIPIVALVMTFEKDKLVEFKFDYWNKGDAPYNEQEAASDNLKKLMKKIQDAKVKLEKTRNLKSSSVAKIMETRYSFVVNSTRITFIPQKKEYYSVVFQSLGYWEESQKEASQKKKTGGRIMRTAIKDRVIRLTTEAEIETLKKRCRQDFIEKHKNIIGEDASEAAITEWADKNLAKTFAGYAIGDVFIEVPMVDQGPKGYCAPATMTRIIQYYGHEVDLNQVAQMMGTEAGGGTYLSDIEKSVKQITRRLRMSFKDLKKYKYRDVKRYIDKGSPLFWVVPEHIRLIVGYNDKNSEILYSDSWGLDGYGRISGSEAEKSTEALFVIK